MGVWCCQPVVCLDVWERRVRKDREEWGNSGQSPSEEAGRKDHVLSLNLSFPISNRDPLGLKLIFTPRKLCAFTYSLQILLWGQCAVKSASRLKRISWQKLHTQIISISLFSTLRQPGRPKDLHEPTCRVAVMKWSTYVLWIPMGLFWCPTLRKHVQTGRQTDL